MAAKRGWQDINDDLTAEATNVPRVTKTSYTPVEDLTDDWGERGD